MFARDSLRGARDSHRAAIDRLRKYEIAARKLCIFDGANPDEMIGHYPEEFDSSPRPQPAEFKIERWLFAAREIDELFAKRAREAVIDDMMR